MLDLGRVRHIAIVATDHAHSKAFYYDILGFTLQSEFYHAERDSWGGNLVLNGECVIELFSFPFPPARPNRPEACGLRHLTFNVDDTSTTVAHLTAHGVEYETIRIDPFIGKCFTFSSDPNNLSLEIHQQQTLPARPWLGNLPGHHFSVCSWI